MQDKLNKLIEKWRNHEDINNNQTYNHIDEFISDLESLKQSEKVDIKDKILKGFTIDRSLLLAFTREWTELYDKDKEKQFEKEVKGFMENLIEDKLNG